METPDQQFGRVLLALEDLVAQETLLLKTQDLAPLRSLQARIAPLVTFLVDHASAADGPLRQRVSALIAQRGNSEQWLAEQFERVKEELQKIQESRQRVARVAPAYGYRADASAIGHLSARG
ncbi:MAG: hypothetical protein ABIZ81_16085 [Opitutaceae bacterium]